MFQVVDAPILEPLRDYLSSFAERFDVSANALVLIQSAFFLMVAFFGALAPWSPLAFLGFAVALWSWRALDEAVHAREEAVDVALVGIRSIQWQIASTAAALVSLGWLGVVVASGPVSTHRAVRASGFILVFPVVVWLRNAGLFWAA